MSLRHLYLDLRDLGIYPDIVGPRDEHVSSTTWFRSGCIKMTKNKYYGPGTRVDSYGGRYNISRTFGDRMIYNISAYEHSKYVYIEKGDVKIEIKIIYPNFIINQSGDQETITSFKVIDNYEMVDLIHDNIDRIHDIQDVKRIID